MERIDKIFSTLGLLSRTECKKAVQRGEIVVDGKVIVSTSEKVDEKGEIYYKGEKIIYSKYIYIMLNKPIGVVSATEDKIEKTVLDLIPSEYLRNGLFPVGRLDKNTEGLVIITNDGDSAHKRLSPKYHVEKEYIFTLADEVSSESIKKIEEGILLKDGYITKPCTIKMINKKEGHIILTEGKYHEIRRMFGACGNLVVSLKRISFGKIKLDENLEKGKCRLLSNEEIEFFVS